MIHVVVMKRLIGLPLLIHFELLWRSRSFKDGGVGVGSFKNRGVGVGSFKNRGVGVGVLCTDSTALVISLSVTLAAHLQNERHYEVFHTG
jgi:hypothetical protein